MASSTERKKRDVTEKCPDCNGEGVTAGYYTVGPVECTTCGGSGTIPKGEAEKMRAQREPEPDASGDE